MIKVFLIALSLFLILGCKSTRTIVHVKQSVKLINPYEINKQERLIALRNYFIEKELSEKKYYLTTEKKQKYLDNITASSMQKAFGIVYGKPYLENTLKYDADNEKFYGFIKSTKGRYSKKISIDVPPKEAESFEKNIKLLKLAVIFDYENDQLSLKKINIKNGRKIFVATIDTGVLDPLVRYSTDPQIATLQKKKYELEKKAIEKKQTIKRQKELEKQRELLEAQIASLQQKSGGVDDIDKFLNKSKKHTKDTTKWLFIIGIENYEYTDPVAYSTNSAKQFKKVMKKRLGIDERHIRTLINTGATSGKIRHRLKEMLAHVKNGDTIYFYYSGHGIPVPAQNNEPYLLAQDMSPEYISDDRRFKLQNIYKSLSDSKASKVIVFIDSCFSGGADNQTLVKGVAATRMKPKRVTFNKKKMIVISAGSGIQYSNKYEDKSNRLFSYYLMRGLIKNNSNMQRLYDYVKSNVQEKSYEMGTSYEQVPIYEGNIKLDL